MAGEICQETHPLLSPTKHRMHIAEFRLEAGMTSNPEPNHGGPSGQDKPSCCMRVAISKYWRMDSALPSAISTIWQARSSIFLPVAWNSPFAVRSGPVCVPRHVTSSTTVFPLTSALWNVAFESGRAVAHPRHRVRTSSTPCAFRWVATSSYTTPAAKDALTAFQSLLLYAMDDAFAISMVDCCCAMRFSC